MKAAIIVPRSDFLDNDYVFPPLGAYYIKRYVEENSKFVVDIINDNNFPHSKHYYDIIGFSATTPQYKRALELFKELPIDIISVLGGPHVHHYDVEDDGWDYIIQGDGCNAFLDILNLHDPDEIPDDKNQKPHRDGTLYQYKYYLDGELTTTIMTARGCPNQCAFCEDAGTKVRLKDPEVVAEEIQECVDLGFSGIMFFDDLFCLNMKRIRELCAVIKPFNIKFRCFAHARNFTEEMAKILADAGCVEIGYGAESLDQNILDTINKHTTPEKIYQLIETAHEHGIRVKAFLMLGLPGESMNSILKMQRFILDSGVDDFDITIYHPYKGTHIADYIGDYDLFIEDNSAQGFYKGKEGHSECIVSTSELTSSEIAYWRKELYSYNKRFKAVVPKPGL